MRSRFAAYAAENIDYIIATTHPAGPQWHADTAWWRDQVARFSRNTIFSGLQIIRDEPGQTESFVTFRAELIGAQGDVSFSERSRFIKVGTRWFYHSGVRV